MGDLRKPFLQMEIRCLPNQHPVTSLAAFLDQWFLSLVEDKKITLGEAYRITKPRLLLWDADLIALRSGLISTLFKALPSDSNVPPGLLRGRAVVLKVWSRDQQH